MINEEKIEILIKATPKILQHEIDENRWLVHWDRKTSVKTIDKLIKILNDLKKEITVIPKKVEKE